jgi:DNA-binding SARP family transcriptional activator
MIRAFRRVGHYAFDVSGTCRIRLLGGFGVEVAGRPVTPGAWRHRRGADLIKLLALSPGHRLHREQVMDILWPELSPEAAGANLRKATHYLRRALGTPEPVVVEAGIVALCPDWSVTTDAEEFDAAAKSAPRRGAEACAAAAALYGGELLPDDRYASWAFEPRERLRLRYIQLLKLAGMWQAVLDADPSDEEAHRALMRAHIGAGNRQAAIRQFERLRETLRADLGIGPDPATVALYEEALAMDGAAAPSLAERANAALARGMVHWNRMELDDALRCAQEARSLAVEARLGRELGEATALLGMVAHAQGRWRELFRAEFEDYLTEPPELVPFLLDAHLCLAEFSLYGPTSHEDTEPFARTLLKIATDAGSVRGEALAQLMLGELLLFAGQLHEASSALARAVALHQAAQSHSGLALAHIRAAEADIARGRRWQASRRLARAARLAQTAPLAPHLLVRTHAALILAAKNRDHALAALDQAERSISESRSCQPCSIGFHVTASITRARAGDARAAQRHLERAERIAGMWQGGPWEAAVWEARGNLRIAQGEREQGLALLKEAADRFTHVGHPLDAARCKAAAA